MCASRCALLTLSFCFGAAVGDSSACSAANGDASASIPHEGADDASLIQFRNGERSKAAFPDFGKELDKLADKAADTASKAADAAKEVADKAADAASKATDAAQEAADKAADAASKAAGPAEEAAGKAAGSAKGAAGKAAGTVKKGAGGSLLEVGEATDTATDAAKSDGASDANLVQLRDKDFPDFGEAADYMKGLANQAAEAASKATGVISEGASAALTAAGKTLKKTLAMLTSKAKELKAQVLAAKANITSGVTSLLTRGKKLTSLAQVPIGEQYEAQLNSTLETFTKAWDLVDTQSETALNAMTKGLSSAGLNSAAATVNSTLQSALADSNNFIASLKSMRGSLFEVSASLLQGEPDQIVLDKVNNLNSTVQKATDYAASFSKSFAGAFASLKDEVVNSTQGILSKDSLAKVEATFKGVQDQAEAAAHNLDKATSEFFEGIRGGLAAAKPAARGAAARLPATGMATLLLLLALHSHQ